MSAHNILSQVNDALAAGGSLELGGLTGTAELRLADNLADAFSIKIKSGNDLVTFTTTNGAEAIAIAPASGQLFALFGAAPVAQRPALTQTYATATVTHSNPTQSALTAASGTSDGVVDDVTGAHDQTILNNNFQDLATEVNAARADILNLKQFVNTLADYIQAIGVCT